MPIIHVTRNVYVNTDSIAKIEAYFPHLAINITMHDGELIQRFIPEERIAHWLDYDRRYAKWLETRNGEFKHHMDAAEKGDRTYRAWMQGVTPPRKYTAEEAFEREFQEFMQYALR